MADVGFFFLFSSFSSIGPITVTRYSSRGWADSCNPAACVTAVALFYHVDSSWTLYSSNDPLLNVTFKLQEPPSGFSACYFPFWLWWECHILDTTPKHPELQFLWLQLDLVLNVFIRLTFVVVSAKIACNCNVRTMKCLCLRLKSHLGTRHFCFASLHL